MFDYGASVRRELEQYTRSWEEDKADEIRTFEVRDRLADDAAETPLPHAVHETRHWAQVALAVRLAGLEPPGDHDLFFSKALW